MKLLTLVCEGPDCTRVFTQKRSNQFYCCEKCQKRAKSRRSAEQCKSTRQEIISTFGTTPRESLAAVNAKARAEGLTYGQYMHKHGYDGWF